MQRFLLLISFFLAFGECRQNIIECFSNSECHKKYNTNTKCAMNHIKIDIVGNNIDYVEQLCMNEEECGKKLDVYGVKMHIDCMLSTGEQMFWIFLTLLCFAVFLVCIRYLVKRGNSKNDRKKLFE